MNGQGSFIMRAERVGSDLPRTDQSMVAEAQAAAGRQSRDSPTRLLDFSCRPCWRFRWLLSSPDVVCPEPRLAYAIVNGVVVLIIACPLCARPGHADVDHGWRRASAQEGVLVKRRGA